MAMRDDAGSWWAIGVEPLLLLVRAAHFAGWRSMIAPLRKSVDMGEVPVGEEFAKAVADYAEAFDAWGSGDVRRAADCFRRVMAFHSTQPPLRPGQSPGEGGGLRLHRAYASADFGLLVAESLEEMGDLYEEAVDAVEWAAASFRAAGCGPVVEGCLAVLGALRSPQTGPVSIVPRGGEPAEGSGVGEALDEATWSLLTEREQEVARLVAAGHTNKAAAAQMDISVRTVDTHVSNVLRKLSLRSRRDLRLLVPPDER